MAAYHSGNRGSRVETSANGRQNEHPKTKKNLGTQHCFQTSKNQATIQLMPTSTA
jgi:hypothetical protein